MKAILGGKAGTRDKGKVPGISTVLDNRRNGKSAYSDNLTERYIQVANF